MGSANVFMSKICVWWMKKMAFLWFLIHLKWIIEVSWKKCGYWAKEFSNYTIWGFILSILLSYGHFSASLFLWWSWGFWLKIPVAFKDHNTKVMNKTSKYWEYRVGVSISWTHCCSTCYILTCLKWSRNEWAATTNFQSTTVYKYSYFVHVLECYF